MEVEPRNQSPPLPTFLIVGAMKSGTTKLTYLLGEAPDVFIPPREIHFFDDDESYRAGTEDYRQSFGGWSGEKEIGENTPTYAYLPEVPKRIGQTLPDVKLIWILREPVKRAYSNYWHAVKRGVEPLGFEEAVRQEPQRLREGQIWKGYLKRSRYPEQVERYLEYFDKEQMHFCLFEEMVEDPMTTLEDVSEFLGVSPPHESADQTPRNPTHIPHSRWIEYHARNIFGNSIIYRSISRLNRRSSQGYPPLDSTLEKELTDRFRESNRELSQLTGLSLDRWR